MRLAVQRGELVGVHRADHQQHGVGARGLGLVELVGVDREVLAQQRQVGRRARLAQVGERAAEVAPPRSAPTPPPRRRARRRAPARRSSRPRGSSPADGERRLCSATSDVPGRASASANGRPSRLDAGLALELGQRALALAAVQRLARGADERVEPDAHAAPAPDSASRTARAAPESIALCARLDAGRERVRRRRPRRSRRPRSARPASARCRGLPSSTVAQHRARCSRACPRRPRRRRPARGPTCSGETS